MCRHLGFKEEDIPILLDNFLGNIMHLSRTREYLGTNYLTKELVKCCEEHIARVCSMILTCSAKNKEILRMIQKKIWPLFLEKEFLLTTEVESILGEKNMEEAIKHNFLFLGFLY